MLPFYSATTNYKGWFFVTFWGWLSDLQLGDKTVTLNHLVVQSLLRESVSGYVVLQPSVLAKRFLLRFMVANLTQEIMDNKNHKGRHHPTSLLYFSCFSLLVDMMKRKDYNIVLVA